VSADDPVAQVLELVAAGKLSADEAAPILDALDDRTQPRASAPGATSAASSPEEGRARYARLEVAESGRKVVDLRIPLSLGRMAVGSIPGLSSDHLAQIERALSSGMKGPILNVQDEDGGGVRIVIE
jgi:hypothetical protein